MLTLHGVSVTTENARHIVASLLAATGRHAAELGVGGVVTAWIALPEGP